MLFGFIHFEPISHRFSWWKALLQVIDGPLPPHRTPVGVGVAGEAVQVGQVMNVALRESGTMFMR